MRLALKRKFCPPLRQNSNYNLAYQNSPLHQSGTSLQIRITSVRGKGNNSIDPKNPYHNTFL